MADERIVDADDVITAAIDLGLYLVQRLAGVGARQRVARQIDYPYRWDLGFC